MASGGIRKETGREFASRATIALTTIRGESKEGVTIIKSDAMAMDKADEGCVSPSDFYARLSRFALYDFLSKYEKLPETNHIDDGSKGPSRIELYEIK